ncbi:hypothetical protein TOK_4180 [Pseudonocardia sp. N23]|nr:hypothetical protein TOK_4180 [Pseudonocardia sp. N23]
MSTHNQSTSDGRRDQRLTTPSQLVIDRRSGIVYPVVDPPGISDAVARVLHARNVAMMTGTCPECSAALVMPNRAERRKSKRAGITYLRARMVHDDDCPAIDPSVPQLTPETVEL